MILAGYAAVASASVTCGGAQERDLTVSFVPLGAEADGGRLATLALLDIEGDGPAELVGAVVPPLSERRPMGLWSASVPSLQGADTPGAEPDLQPMVDLSAAGLHVLPGDLDGDGHADMVLADPARDEVFRIVWLSDGAAISPRYRATLGPQPIVGDLGGDGVDELLSVSPSGAVSAWSLEEGAPVSIASGSVPDAVEQTVGDLDGDGAPEWIMARGPSRTLTVAWRGDLRAQEEVRVPVRDARAPLAVDLDSDGHAEILLVDRRRGGVRILEGDGLRRGPWVVHLRDKAGRDAPQSLHVGDIDGDGCLDVLLHSFTTHELAIAWGGNRDRFTSQHVQTGPGPVAVGNIDGVPGDEIAVVAEGGVMIIRWPGS